MVKCTIKRGGLLMNSEEMHEWHEENKKLQNIVFASTFSIRSPGLFINIMIPMQNQRLFIDVVMALTELDTLPEEQ